MTVFTWNYVLLALTILAVYKFAGKNYRALILATVSVLYVLFQRTPIPILGLIFASITIIQLTAGFFLTRWVARVDTPFTRKFILAGSILWALLPLILFRYLFGESAVFRLFLMATEELGVSSGSILAPLGISYFTFRLICYMVEIYRKTIEPIRFTEYLAYIAFFPAMLAGPITRVIPFVEQLRSNRKPDKEDLIEGGARIVVGVFKKLVLGGIFYQLCYPLIVLPIGTGDQFFEELAKFESWQLWAGFYFNFLYIYLDFSGYSDIAIGTARLFGFRIIENFNWPILATNIADFWQRFHISLTSWIRDYVYIPLGGNRVSAVRGAFNTILMMILIGVWHGGARHYVVWGFYMGGCLIVYRYWRSFKRKRFPDRRPTWWGKLIGWYMTMTCYSFGLVVFNFSTAQSVMIYAKMFGAW